MPRGQGQPVLRGKGRGWVATQASVTHVSPFPRAIVVVAHFVCIKLITAWHAMLTMRAIARQRKREREREGGGRRAESQQVTQKCQNFHKLHQLLNAKSAGDGDGDDMKSNATMRHTAYT